MGEYFDDESFINIHRIRIRRADGSIEDIAFKPVGKNLVVDEGRTHIRDVIFRGGTAVDPWYLGLVDGTPTLAAGDTAAQIGGSNGWDEITDYSGATRPEFVDAATGTGQVDNAASVASYDINATVTVGGVFLISVNTKGSTTGTLMAVVAFTGGDRSLSSGDTLEVTYTNNTTDDGA